MTTTERGTPTGEPMLEGLGIKIAFAADSNVEFWEESVKPFGLDGGEPIPVTSHWNTSLETFALKTLKRLTPLTLTVQYSPVVIDAIMALINVNGWITIHWPGTATIKFVGGLTKFEPGDIKAGEQPKAQITIVPTNKLAGSIAEVHPVFSAAGTGT